MNATKFSMLSGLLILSTLSFAQSSETVEMADILRQDGKIYTVVAGIVIILTAVIALLLRVDRKISSLEKNEKKEN